MKIPRSSGQPPLTPDRGKIGRGMKSERKPETALPDMKKTVEKLARATGSSVSKLVNAGGGAADFKTIGMKVLMQTAEQATSGAGKTAMTAASTTEQTWRNVGQSIFGSAEKVSEEVAAGVSRIGNHVREAAFDKAASSISEMVKGTQPLDINSLVQSVLREAYSESTNDLRFYADKVRHFNSTKKEIRDHMRDIRERLSTP